MNPLDVMNRICRMPADVISLSEQSVLIALLSTVDGRKGYTGWATQAQLAAWAKVTDRTVRTALATLTAKGMVSQVKGAHMGHTFTLNAALIVGFDAEAHRKQFPTHRKQFPTPPEMVSAPPGNGFLPPPETVSDTALLSALRSTLQTTISSADAADPTPTPEAAREPEPADPPSPESRPDASGQADGVRRGAERGEQAPAAGQSPTGDPRPESDSRRAGPTVSWAKGLPPGLVAEVLACIEAVKQRPINPERTGTDAKTILALWRATGKPSQEVFGADLRAVIRWARESPDKLAARDIRAEGWEAGTDRHADLATLCRQDKWSARLDAARSWGDGPSGVEGYDWTESDAARLVVQRVLDGGDLYHRDERILWLAKRTITHIGKRAAWRGKGSTVDWISAWRKEWPASVAAWEAKQEQAGVAK